MVAVSAPGKAILFGEHAVVYGEPAVAVAIDARVTVNLTPCTGEWKVGGTPLDPEKHPHLDFLRRQILGSDSEPHSFQVVSELFPAAGLGSSAALSAAACSALIQASGATESDVVEVARLAHFAEASAQGGRASPIDTSTSTLGGCVFVSDQRESLASWQYTRSLTTPEGEREWEVHSVDLPNKAESVWLVVGSTGIHSPTGEMVAKVAELLKRNPEKEADIKRMGEVARAGAKAISDGDFEEVGRLMDEAHVLLSGIGVSCQELDDMVEVARQTSLGAKLTGAGGGGCMLALTRNPEETAAAVEMRGGRVIVTPLGATGVRVENP